MEKEAQLRIAQGRAPLKRSMDEPSAVFTDLLGVWECWWQLGSGRQVGMAIGGLSWTDMRGWCEDHGITGEARLRWIRLLIAMDETARMQWSRKQGAKSDANP